MNVNKVFIIAEAGVNHNGNPDLAFQLVDAAVEAGADAVKFQTFKAEHLVSKTAKKADYQKKTTDAAETQYEMLKKLELSKETFFELQKYCNKKKIQFMSTAFDKPSLDFLVRELKLTTLKIASGEITNAPFLLEHARTKCSLIISTGMCTLTEVKQALGIVSFGYLNKSNSRPSEKAFEEAFKSIEGRNLVKEKIILLHCTTEYPAPYDTINLNAMRTLAENFSLPVGYSDHSEGIIVPIAAVANGACVIEKHFTLDKSMMGPDHRASLAPEELKEMVKAIRIIEQIMGDGKKIPYEVELKNSQVARKSIVASISINKGECFSEKNISVMRPGTGLDPIFFWDLLGEKAKRNFQPGELINE